MFDERGVEIQPQISGTVTERHKSLPLLYKFNSPALLSDS